MILRLNRAGCLGRGEFHMKQQTHARAGFYFKRGVEDSASKRTKGRTAEKKREYLYVY